VGARSSGDDDLGEERVSARSSPIDNPTSPLE
jgi:hypothetical protein